MPKHNAEKRFRKPKYYNGNKLDVELRMSIQHVTEILKFIKCKYVADLANILTKLQDLLSWLKEIKTDLDWGEIRVNPFHARYIRIYPIYPSFFQDLLW